MQKRGRHKIIPDLKQVESLAARGLTDAEIAAALGISKDTLIQRKKEFSEFSDSLKKGKSRGIAQVANKLFEAAMNGESWAICFYLKTRAGWSEKQQIDHTSSDGSMSPVKTIEWRVVDPQEEK